MNRLTKEKRAQVVACLVEGNSISATVRMTGAAKNTVTKLLVDLGAACVKTHNRLVRDLQSQRVQVDEIWSFVDCKAKNVHPERMMEIGLGDAWTWTAIDADTKLCIAWHVGGRDAGTARVFMDDVAARLANRVQLTSDGHQASLSVVREAFNYNIDYAMLVKLYGQPSGSPSPEARYSPAKINGTKRHVIAGMPDPAHVNTGFAEQNKLTMRMSMKRLTRLTNAFSKKVENLRHALAVHFVHFNFVRVHMTLKTTPAVAAGIAARPWTIEDMIELLETKRRKQVEERRAETA
jgi:IS1 family transposase